MKTTHQRIAAFLLGTCGLIFAACGDDDQDTDASTTTSSGTGGNDGGASGVGGEPTTGTTSTGLGGGGQGGGQGGAGDGGATGEGGASCAEEPGDDACVVCNKMYCCDEGLACFADAECSVCFECLQTRPNPGNCFQNGACDFRDPETEAILSCSQDHCMEQCQGG
jgi:hypothetical protein